MTDAPEADPGQPVMSPGDGAPATAAQPGGQPSSGQQPSPGGQPGFGSRATATRPWKSKPDGVTTFRHSAPLVLWWAWIAFALWNVYDLAISHRGIGSARLGVALLLVTGVMYACTLHSRVDSDDDGVTIYNPFKHHRVPWGGVEGIYLGDSVEFCCHRPPPLPDKTIYSWALYSRRRSRVRMQMQGNLFSPASRRISERAPQEAAELARQQAAQLMAVQLGKLAQNARDSGAAQGYLRSSWSWRPIAAMVVPAVGLLVTFLIS